MKGFIETDLVKGAVVDHCGFKRKELFRVMEILFG